MRYTTIIDISEIPAVYRCLSARLLYFHLAMKAGYHDNDRDIVTLSLRQMADGAGLTLSATRHALAVLEKADLVKMWKGKRYVRKWLKEQSITPRPQQARAAKDAALNEERRRANEERERKQEEARENDVRLLEQGETQMTLYYKELQRRAAQGDKEAVRLMKKHQATYEKDLERIRQYQQQKRK